MMNVILIAAKNLSCAGQMLRLRLSMTVCQIIHNKALCCPQIKAEQAHFP
jgi:hypothetical protein